MLPSYFLMKFTKIFASSKLISFPIYIMIPSIPGKRRSKNIDDYLPNGQNMNANGDSAFTNGGYSQYMGSYDLRLVYDFICFFIFLLYY